MRRNNLWGLLILVISIIFTSCSNDGTDYTKVNGEKGSSSTNVISLDEARVELEQLLDDTNRSALTRSGNRYKKIISEAFTLNGDQTTTRATNEEEPTIHVFNFKDNEGFALMAGNREMPSLLALNDPGSISQTEAIIGIRK